MYIKVNLLVCFFRILYFLCGFYYCMFRGLLVKVCYMLVFWCGSDIYVINWFVFGL